jgi:hypothetical protein
MIELAERKNTSSNDRYDGVGALGAFACDSDLIARRADNSDATLILLF